MESFSIDELQSGTAASCAEVSGKLSPIALRIGAYSIFTR